MTARFDYGLPADEPEIARYAAIASTAYCAPRAELEPKMKRLGARITRVVRQRGALVGGLLLYRTGQWFGGRNVAMTAIGAVAVAPEARAQGAATALMRATVRDLHAAGIALSTLYPAVLPLYQRAGYEIAGSRYRIELQPRALHHRERALPMRPLAREDDQLKQQAYRRYVRHANGPIDQSASEWRRAEAIWRPAREVYGVFRGKELEGYVGYVPRLGEGERLDCREFVALTPAAGRRLLAFFADHRSQVQRITFYASPHDPLLMELDVPCTRIRLLDPWMLRIVDVAAALAGRGYPTGLEARIDFAVRDDLIRANRDRFRLEIARGRGRVVRGGRGTVKIDVRALAALYTGYLPAAELAARTGRLEASRTQESLLHRAFVGPPPWMVDEF